MPDPIQGNGQEERSFESAFTSALAEQQAAAPVTPPAAAPPAPISAPPPLAAQSAAPVSTTQAASPPATSTTTSNVPAGNVTLSAFAEAAREAGLPYEGLSDADIARAMSQHIVKTKPYASYGQRLAPYATEINEYFSREQKPEETPASVQPAANEQEWTPERYFEEKWSAPKWDEQYTFAIQQGLVQRNAENGLYEATPGFETMVMEILPGLNRAQTWTAQQWQGITRGNPYQQFYDVLREPLQRAWQADVAHLVQQQFEQFQARQRVDQFETTNQQWMYTKDPTTGQTVFTPQGQAFYEAIDYAKGRYGITDPDQLIELATRLTGVPAGTPSQPAPVLPVAPVVPPVPAVASAQATNEMMQSNFLQTALQRASHAPQAGGFAQSAPDHPVNVSEGELNNMFVSAFRSAAQGGPA